MAADGKQMNLMQGTQAALKLLKVDKPVPQVKSKAADGEKAAQPDFEGRPLDYRRAIASARSSSSSVYSQLQKLGMAKPLEELLELT